MPENPFLLGALIVLSVVSFAMCWRGFRGSNLPYGIMGVGVGVPTFSIEDWKFWIAGVVVLAFGYWLRESMENL